MKKFYIAKSRRLRSTPYTSRIENHGVIAYLEPWTYFTESGTAQSAVSVLHIFPKHQKTSQNQPESMIPPIP